MLLERWCMGIAYIDKRITALAAATTLLLSLSLGGCATSTMGSPMDARAEAPMPPKTGGYLPVEDLPPLRDTPVMTLDERSKLQKELIAARDRQAAIVKAQGVAPADPVKPQ